MAEESVLKLRDNEINNRTLWTNIFFSLTLFIVKYSLIKYSEADLAN